VLRIGFGSLGVAANIVPFAIFAFMAIRIAQSSVMFTGNTRLPMVAGWDHLLPGWFTRLHPRFRTPINSIIFVGAMTLAFGLTGLIGVGEQEAFQLLWNASGIFYALTYLVMFAAPLIGRRGIAASTPVWLKLAALSGFLMTLLYVGLSILPIVRVESAAVFAAKISGVIIVANVIGIAIFLAGERRRRWNLTAVAGSIDAD
jgi:amino acid transporter